MKRTLITLVVLICMVGAFALDGRVSASLVPYGAQIVSSSEADKAVTSRYGFGIEASYSHDIDRDLLGIDGLFAEGGLAWGMYPLKAKEGSTMSIMLFAGAGYSMDITDLIRAYAHLDALIDLMLYGGKASVAGGFRVGAGAGHDLDCGISVKAGVDASFSFAKGESARYTDIRIATRIGASMDL